TTQYKVGDTYQLKGKFVRKNKFIESVNPVQNKDAEDIVPVYSLEGRVTGTLLKKLVRQVLEKVQINENLPTSILSKEELIDLDTAVRNLHFPQNKDFLSKSLKRMKFQEMFAYSLKIMMAKHRRQLEEQGITFTMSPRLK